MSRTAKNRSKQQLKLYKKVRNTSSWGSAVVYLLLICLFIGMAVFLAGFVIEYIFESKFADGYSEAAHTAKLYEAGQTDSNFLDFINLDSSEFVVEDENGNTVFQKGSNTRSSNGGDLELSNGEEHYTVYADTENGILTPDGKGGLDFKLKDFIKWFRSQEGDIRLPIWAAVDIEGGKLYGKIYISFNSRDTVLFVELISGLLLIILVFFVLTLIKVIRSAVNYKRVVRLFYSDPVTGGHNWMWFVRNGEDRVQSFFTRKDSFAVVELVMRNYRNYCLCHSIAEGEELLSRIDKLLSAEMQKGELCAHADGAGFPLLLKYENEELLKARLREIVAKLRGMDTEHDFSFQLGADIVEPLTNSAGKPVKRKDFRIENAYNNACSARAALADTDETGIRIFDSNLFEEQRWRDTVAEHQWRALKNEEFVVYYQPKYDPRTNELRGAEALIRWDSPEFGFVTPGRIIPIFEKNGFITEIDHYMIRHAAKDQKAWLDAGYNCVPVSVNVSRAHFVENDLAVQIRDIVDEAGCPRELIEIELTESAFFDDKKAMIETIGKLKEFGFEVSMDDFGAGYSSLNSLKDMPLDVLKLDADFFRGENAGERGEIVVSEAIKLAKSLDMRTVAEGVEEKEQVDFLARQGCDMIQGFYFAKPMPAKEYAERMTRISETAEAPSKDERPDQPAESPLPDES